MDGSELQVPPVPVAPVSTSFICYCSPPPKRKKVIWAQTIKNKAAGLQCVFACACNLPLSKRRLSKVHKRRQQEFIGRMSCIIKSRFAAEMQHEEFEFALSRRRGKPLCNFELHLTKDAARTRCSLAPRNRRVHVK